MDILGYLIIGLVAGALARLAVPGRDPMGIFGTLLLGLVGAFIGGLLGRALFDDSDGVGLVGAFIGAVIALLAYRAMNRERAV